MDGWKDDGLYTRFYHEVARGGLMPRIADKHVAHDVGAYKHASSVGIRFSPSIYVEGRQQNCVS